jgi:hypothetical protein
MKPIDLKKLVLLFDQGMIKSARIDSYLGNWVLVFVDHKQKEHIYHTARSGQMREFKTIEAVISLLKNLGMRELTVRF